MQPGTLNHSDTHFIPGNASNRRGGGLRHISHLFLATAFFQCWQYIIGFSVWATIICLICQYVKDISVPSILLTVFGTVLGFVISYRTSSTFERYNEGRRYWSSIIYNTRTLSRAVWFHIPEIAVTVGANEDEKRARTLVEKKTVLNLAEAFAVALKHYLRGEEGINYIDLYHLTRYLPAHALPGSIPEVPYDLNQGEFKHSSEDSTVFGTSESRNPNLTAQGLPMPATSPTGARFRSNRRGAKGSTFHLHGEPILLPARNPPPFGIFDIFPLTLLVKPLLRHGFDIGGIRAQKTFAKLNGEEDSREGGVVVSHNIPLEITFYLSAYISALQQRKVCDVPTINLLLGSLNNLVDSLSGLERILTTPVPFSYSIHLWTVTLLYCALLPFQLWVTLQWLTVPATAIFAFIFTGFITAGEEIENPFGFARNDLNLDHFTHNIIRVELASITSVPVPDPAEWCFRPENSSLFSMDGQERTPELWVKEGVRGIRNQLAKGPVDLFEDQEVSEKKKVSLDSNKKIKKHKAHEEPHQQEEHSAAKAAAAGDPMGDD